MKQETLVEILIDQTRRTLWEVKNVMDCVSDANWSKEHCHMPIWKHIYHMLHSLDLWFINPRDSRFAEPYFHEKDLNNLDVSSGKQLTRNEIETYFSQIKKKIEAYLDHLQDAALLEKPERCEYTKFTLILAQYRHLHTHMGMLMGFIIDDTRLWPRVVGLEGTIPEAPYSPYF